MAESVYQRVLGDDFALLDLRLRRYFGMPPEGAVGVGRGVYDHAGAVGIGGRLLRPVLTWLAWQRILFPESGDEIAFTVVNRADERRGTLSAQRTFDFDGVRRVMEDTMSVRRGRLRDRLGRTRWLEVDLELSVVDGGLHMVSRGLGIRLGLVRLPLPRVARVTLDERSDPDGVHQRVDVRLTAPLIGEFFRYSGIFSYDYRQLR
ncbi:DUF4166 domain-containing protein [Schumannella soli]|uniref:DUF4166 domain-containing protein n=1 Tax=Schumannella soli TaxID=2590779 RepID=A0A506Y2R7_9MICO|nr:DUF4166 domain-containing protein [Schumannella soli]TPW74689.1 DUF4166 domain-containing protein [Schumannella soli]